MTDTVAGPELGASFRGTTIRPDDSDYDTVRAVYNGSIDRRPAVIVRPTSAADVMDAVTYAQRRRAAARGALRRAQRRRHLRCRGRRADRPVRLKGVHVDPERGTAIAQAGVLWGEYDREPSCYGVATPGGRVTTTGVGGFSLGGGYGWLSPKYGLTCDNLVAADLVTATAGWSTSARTRTPSCCGALRGAGANFGVVTSYELRLHPIPPLMLAGMLVVPNDDGRRRRSRAYRDYVEQAPEELSPRLATILAPPEEFVPPELVGTPVLGISCCWVGDPAEAEEALRTAAGAGTAPAWTSSSRCPTPRSRRCSTASPRKGWLNYHRGPHLSALTDEMIEPFLAVGREIHSPMTQGIIFRHGGAVAGSPRTPPRRATARRRTWPTRSPAGRHRRRPTARWPGYGGSPRRSRRRRPEAPT